MITLHDVAPLRMSGKSWQRQQLEAERKQIEKERQQTQRLRVAFAAAVLLAVGAVGAAVWGFDSSRSDVGKSSSERAK